MAPHQAPGPPRRPAARHPGRGPLGLLGPDRRGPEGGPAAIPGRPAAGQTRAVPRLAEADAGQAGGAPLLQPRLDIRAQARRLPRHRIRARRLRRPEEPRGQGHHRPVPGGRGRPADAAGRRDGAGRRDRRPRRGRPARLRGPAEPRRPRRPPEPGTSAADPLLRLRPGVPGRREPPQAAPARAQGGPHALPRPGRFAPAHRLRGDPRRGPLRRLAADGHGGLRGEGVEQPLRARRPEQAVAEGQAHRGPGVRRRRVHPRPGRTRPDLRRAHPRALLRIGPHLLRSGGQRVRPRDAGGPGRGASPAGDGRAALRQPRDHRRAFPALGAPGACGDRQVRPVDGRRQAPRACVRRPQAGDRPRGRHPREPRRRAAQGRSREERRRNVSSFPCRREPIPGPALDSRLRGNDGYAGGPSSISSTRAATPWTWTSRGTGSA